MWCINTYEFTCVAQNKFEGQYKNNDLNIELILNLEDDNITVPGLDGLESCYGYLSGKLNGNWIILKVKEQNLNKAIVRMTCDRGNDAEDVTLELRDDELLLYQSENYIKTIQAKKYVKIPKPLILKKIIN